MCAALHLSQILKSSKVSGIPSILVRRSFWSFSLKERQRRSSPQPFRSRLLAKKQPAASQLLDLGSDIASAMLKMSTFHDMVSHKMQWSWQNFECFEPFNRIQCNLARADGLTHWQSQSKNALHLRSTHCTANGTEFGKKKTKKSNKNWIIPIQWPHFERIWRVSHLQSSSGHTKASISSGKLRVREAISIFASGFRDVPEKISIDFPDFARISNGVLRCHVCANMATTRERKGNKMQCDRLNRNFIVIFGSRAKNVERNCFIACGHRRNSSTSARVRTTS